MDGSLLKDCRKRIQEEYLKPLQEYAMDFGHGGDNIRKLNMYLLNQFYLKPYAAAGDFYQEFYERLETASRALSTD